MREQAEEPPTTMDAISSISANCRCSRFVYVGNISFHASEDELRDACELIGPVVSLRVAADASTDKRKGYAFIEYRDDETARSACRNLHGHFLRDRQLRVGIADRKQQLGRLRRADHEPVGIEDAVHAASLVSGSTVAHVTRYLATLSRLQLREMVAELEKHGGAEAAKLLREHVPWLATAMEQAQHLLDMDAAAAAAEEARIKTKRERESACSPDDADHVAKKRKAEAVRGIVPPF